MNTNVGQNYQAIFLLIVSGLDQMPDNDIKHALLGITMICMAAVAWWTRGSGLSTEDAKSILDVIHSKPESDHADK